MAVQKAKTTAPAVKLVKENKLQVRRQIWGGETEYLNDQGAWVKCKNYEEARKYAATHGYDGIKIVYNAFKLVGNIAEVKNKLIKQSTNGSYELITANFSGKLRRETLNGRRYVVAPITMIVTGVLNGSKGPLFYPPEELDKDPGSWNNMPIVVNHPQDTFGSPVSARDPEVLNRQGIGFVFRTVYDGTLNGEGWFDIENTKRVSPLIWNKLNLGRPIELSTGLFTDNEPTEGVFNGQQYKFIARNYRPDHLAVFSDRVGACSVRDGCGVLVNTEIPPENEGISEIKDWIRQFNEQVKEVDRADKRILAQHYYSLGEMANDIEELAYTNLRVDSELSNKQKTWLRSIEHTYAKLSVEYDAKGDDAKRRYGYLNNSLSGDIFRKLISTGRNIASQAPSILQEVRSLMTAEERHLTQTGQVAAKALEYAVRESRENAQAALTIFRRVMKGKSPLDNAAFKLHLAINAPPIGPSSTTKPKKRSPAGTGGSFTPPKGPKPLSPSKPGVKSTAPFAGKIIGKYPPAGLGGALRSSAKSAGTALGRRVGGNLQRAGGFAMGAGGAVGGAHLGARGGAAIGAGVGSLFGGVGAGPGAAIGAGVGGISGSILGGIAGKRMAKGVSKKAGQGAVVGELVGGLAGGAGAIAGAKQVGKGFAKQFAKPKPSEYDELYDIYAKDFVEYLQESLGYGDKSLRKQVTAWRAKGTKGLIAGKEPGSEYLPVPKPKPVSALEAGKRVVKERRENILRGTVDVAAMGAISGAGKGYKKLLGDDKKKQDTHNAKLPKAGMAGISSVAGAYSGFGGSGKARAKPKTPTFGGGQSGPRKPKPLAGGEIAGRIFAKGGKAVQGAAKSVTKDRLKYAGGALLGGTAVGTGSALGTAAGAIVGGLGGPVGAVAGGVAGGAALSTMSYGLSSEAALGLTASPKRDNETVYSWGKRAKASSPFLRGFDTGAQIGALVGGGGVGAGAAKESIKVAGSKLASKVMSKGVLGKRTNMAKFAELATDKYGRINKELLKKRNKPLYEAIINPPKKKVKDTGLIIVKQPSHR